MKGIYSCFALGAVTLLSTVPSFAGAEGYTIRRDAVIPIVFDDQLTIRTNHVGDRFTAHVDHDRDLPDGTKLIGRVDDVKKAYGNQPAEMRLRFTDIELPNGGRVELNALPIPLSDRYVRRNDDGRLVARSNDKQRETMVIGGAVAGFVIGSILHKQLEGTLIGTAAGVILAETNRKSNNDLVVAKGQRMGALVSQDVVVDIDRYAANPPPIDGNRNDRGPSDDQVRKDDTNRSGDQRNPDDRLSVGQMRITYQDRDLSFVDKEMPYRAGDTVMVPLYKTSEQLGLHAEQTGDKVWIVEDQDNSLRLEQDSQEYRLNGKQATMSRSLTIRDDVVYVPLEVLAKVRPEKISVNGNRIEDKPA